MDHYIMARIVLRSVDIWDCSQPENEEHKLTMEQSVRLACQEDDDDEAEYAADYLDYLDYAIIIHAALVGPEKEKVVTWAKSVLDGE